MEQKNNKDNPNFFEWNQKNSQNNENNNTDSNKNGKFNKRPNSMGVFIIIALAVMFSVSFFFNNIQGINVTDIPYSQFLKSVERGEVITLSIVEEKEIEGVLSDGTQFKTRIPYFDANLMNLLQKHNLSFSGTIRPLSFFQILSTALPWLVSIVFILYMLRSLRRGIGGGSLPFSKSKVRSYVPDNKDNKTTFKDVAGQKEAKSELEEVVEFLKRPEKFQAIGAKIPRGILLVGAPGTGKTLLARACAGEAGVKFLYMSGSDFVEMFAGVGASRVRELFTQARASSPCIVFIDELDAVGRSRASGYGGGVHDEREQTLNQLLVEMDGFENRDRIIVLAATNRADVLDKALLRPGRFDRHVVVDMPDLHEREQILKIHTEKIKLDKDVDLVKVAKATVGCSGADLANLINESAIHAAKLEKKVVSMSDLEESRDKILMGAARKSKVITPTEKLKTARHEAGHALLHLLLKNADPLHKVTIIPRGRALGVAFSLPEKDSYAKGKSYLLDRISICYGGYISEQMYYDETSTGVQNDLEQATQLANRMVRDWGMSNLGAISYSKKQTSLFMPMDSPGGEIFSDATSREIDSEIKGILSEAFENAKKLLVEHKTLLDKLTDKLMIEETLLGEQVHAITGIPIPEPSSIDE